MKMKHFLRPTVLFLTLFVFLFSFAPSAAYAQNTLQEPKELAVYDSTGKKFGEVIGGGPGAASVAFQIPPPIVYTNPTPPPATITLSNPLQVVLSVGKTGFFPSGGQIVFQNSTTCTGQPFFSFGFSTPGTTPTPTGFTDFLSLPVALLDPTNFTTGTGKTIHIPDPTATTFTNIECCTSCPSTTPTCSPVSPATSCTICSDGTTPPTPCTTGIITNCSTTPAGTICTTCPTPTTGGTTTCTTCSTTCSASSTTCSQLTGGPAPAQPCSPIPGPTTVQAKPAVSLGIDLVNPATGGFTPPFSLRPAFEVLLP